MLLFSNSDLNSKFGFVLGNCQPSNTLITYKGDPPHIIGNLPLLQISLIFLLVSF